jgi:hydroxymethylpyrimidine/phosphomethylpyrimidine kinase
MHDPAGTTNGREALNETAHHSAQTGPATVVAIGGLDSSGGAGLIRDYLTGQALGVTVVLVGTAWTLQTAAGVASVDVRAPDRLQQAVRAALGAVRGGGVAVKVGMVAAAPQVAALVAALEGFAGPVVFDPVLRASSGGVLFDGDPAQLLPLLARATLVTPNLAEAEALTGAPVASADDARRAARRLLELGARAVLIKGGHLPGDADDLLAVGGDPAAAPAEHLLRAPRLPNPTPRGTGCALATAIAAALARPLPLPLPEAVAEAKRWLHARIAAAHTTGGEHHL